ncbi:otoferlin-like isoform X1 [Brachionus plicatilis]|uniref:Otoferlin-like isoform X1 n=1 Tax=Brachionus plicatilis TaxID=10195 RepID=A0A3M7T9G6_BRAPC|nr:otoferlin-like isoform X1 [Brachionus plicatilis]
MKNNVFEFEEYKLFLFLSDSGLVLKDDEDKEIVSNLPNNQLKILSITKKIDELPSDLKKKAVLCEIRSLELPKNSSETTELLKKTLSKKKIRCHVLFVVLTWKVSVELKIKLYYILYIEIDNESYVIDFDNGKLEAEFQLLSEQQALEKPAGFGRNEPDALPEPDRPQDSFAWFLSPLRTFRYVIWKNNKCFFIQLFLQIQTNYY